MKTPHKHAELIKAWADGAEIECRNKNFQDTWSPMTNACWDLEFLEFRIKPEPKPDMVFYGQLDEPARGAYTLGSCFTRQWDAADKLKLTFDGSTGKLKSAEIL